MGICVRSSSLLFCINKDDHVKIYESDHVRKILKNQVRAADGTEGPTFQWENNQIVSVCVAIYMSPVILTVS